VVFDLNRRIEIEPLLKKDPTPDIALIRDMPNRAFVFSLVTNASAQGDRVIVRTLNPGQSTPAESETGLTWPKGVYSVSHVALPFPGNDPVYGGDQPGESPGIQLGNVALRGEKGVIQIPASDMLRLRWNPFYPYLERRILERLQLK
jgi:hypothetical protein